MNENLYQIVSELTAMAPIVRDGFNDLFDHNLDIVPIPFFGNVIEAQVITVGLNPSDGEIKDRGWSQQSSPVAVCKRLVSYFDKNLPFMRHQWFAIWEEALDEIGVSYESGSAAHLDLCPWPTRPMTRLPDQHRAALLLHQSLSWFWECLRLAENARLVLIAGSAPVSCYINEVLFKAGTANGDALLLKPRRIRGDAFVNYHQIRVAGKEIPVFFCSVSPSSRTKYLLPVRVREHREQLLKFLV